MRDPMHKNAEQVRKTPCSGEESHPQPYARRRFAIRKECILRPSSRSPLKGFRHPGQSPDDAARMGFHETEDNLLFRKVRHLGPYALERIPEIEFGVVKQPVAGMQGCHGLF